MNTYEKWGEGGHWARPREKATNRMRVSRLTKSIESEERLRSTGDPPGDTAPASD
jgi:hypothetical protein